MTDNPDARTKAESAEPSFYKSSFCDSNTCVEVARTASGVLVRDSKGDGVKSRSVLQFTLSEWEAFISGVKHGEFDL